MLKKLRLLDKLIEMPRPSCVRQSRYAPKAPTMTLRCLLYRFAATSGSSARFGLIGHASLPTRMMTAAKFKIFDARNNSLLDKAFLNFAEGAYKLIGDRSKI